MNNYMRYVLHKAKLNRVPVSGVLEITGQCNYNCKMCYIHNHDNKEYAEKELPTEFWLDMIDVLIKEGTINFLITGGEPLLRKDFSEIYKKCKQSGSLVSVNTNGSLITDEHIELFDKMPPAAVNISLYGYTDEGFRSLESSCVSGISDRVKSNILKLHDRGIQVGINFMSTVYNYGEAEDVFNFAHENNINIKYASYTFAPRVGESACKRPDAGRSAEMLAELERMKYGDKHMQDKASCFRKGEFGQRNTDDESCLSEQSGVRCNAGSCSYWITYDGFLLPCGMMPDIRTDLKDKTFDEAWKMLVGETDKLKMPSECDKCKYRIQCDACAAMGYSENGRYDKVPGYICEKTKRYIELLKENYQSEGKQ